MSNKSNFQSKMKELGHTISFSPLPDFFDANGTTSTFYTKLINLFTKLKNDAQFKDCKFDINKTYADANQKHFYLYLKGDCVSKLKDSQIVKNSGLTFDPNSNSLGIERPVVSPKTTDSTQTEYERLQKLKQLVYGPMVDKIAPGIEQGKVTTADVAKQFTTEGVSNEINRIKKLING